MSESAFSSAVWSASSAAAHPKRRGGQLSAPTKPMPFPSAFIRGICVICGCCRFASLWVLVCGEVVGRPPAPARQPFVHTQGKPYKQRESVNDSSAGLLTLRQYEV